MDLKEKALECHKNWNGKLETVAKSKVNSREDLAIAYTPGVAEPCKVIAEDKEAAYTYTWKSNTVHNQGQHGCCCFRRKCRTRTR